MSETNPNMNQLNSNDSNDVDISGCYGTLMDMDASGCYGTLTDGGEASEYDGSYSPRNRPPGIEREDFGENSQLERDIIELDSAGCTYQILNGKVVEGYDCQ